MSPLVQALISWALGIWLVIGCLMMTAGYDPDPAERARGWPWAAVLWPFWLVGLMIAVWLDLTPPFPRKPTPPDGNDPPEDLHHR